MARPKPPDKGKFSDLFRKEWKLELPRSRERWFRTPAKMIAEDFRLEEYRSLAGVEPFFFKKFDGDKEKFYHAVRVSYKEDHESFEHEFENSSVLVGVNGRVFQAVKKEELFQQEKRLYLTGLPSEIGLDIIRKNLEDFVELAEESKKIFYLERGRFSGKFMVKVKKFIKVPPRQAYLECDDVVFNGVGYTIFSTGYAKETPVAQTQRKCFKCGELHLARDCPKKMTFSWKCTRCSLTDLQCYEGKCALDQMVRKIHETNKSLLVKNGKPTTNYVAEAKAMMKESDKQFQIFLNKTCWMILGRWI